MSSNNLLGSELADWADQPHSINLSQVRLICEELIELRSEKADLKTVMDQLEALSKRHADLVKASKVLKDYVDLPVSDYCTAEMNEAWEVFKALETKDE